MMLGKGEEVKEDRHRREGARSLHLRAPLQLQHRRRRTDQPTPHGHAKSIFVVTMPFE